MSTALLGHCGAAISTRVLLLLVHAGLAARMVVAEPTSVIALTLPQSNTTSGYFPLSAALRSVMRLAADDINAGVLTSNAEEVDYSSSASTISVLEGNLTLSIVEVATGSRAIEGLCDALESVGENGTFGIVGPMLSSQASLLETVTNDFFGLPMFSPSASAARAATYFSSGATDFGGQGSYLFGVHPDVFEEMKAVARLILDMKMERDLARGWYHTSERVSMIYPDDSHGTIAASAFVRAVRSVEGINVDSNALGELPATIELVNSEPLEPVVGADHRHTLASLVESHASIVVFLSEGYDGEFVRSVIEQAMEVDLVNDGVQWYLNGAAARDGIFTVNDTYHDAQLAYDFRGALGVRACPALDGPGSEMLENLTSRWVALDSDRYPGAGFGTLTPDGRLDPLLAYAYDAVRVAAAAIFSVKETAIGWGGSLEGFVTDSCPFRTAGLWEDGELIRDEALRTELVGVTGKVDFMEAGSTVSSGAGAAGSGWRKANGTEFCALNLQPHATLGATFAATMVWKPETFVDVNGTESTFEKISDYQKNQTFPLGNDVYPFDRPTLSRQHFDIITEEAAVPFTIISGRENDTSDFEGIAMDLVKVLSNRLGFTYSMSVVNSSVTTDEVVGYVANGTYDMMASWVAITEGRMETVSFSYPYMMTGLSFVYRPENLNKVSFWKVFQPFEGSLWAAVVLTTVLMFFLLWVFDGAKNDLFTDGVPSASGSKRRYKSGMAMSAYVTGALLMGQMAHEPYSVESYVLTTGWMFACFILAASFTAELAAFLSAEKEEALSFTVDDLRNGAVPHTQVAVQQDSSMQVFYEESIMQCFGYEDCYGGAEENVPVPCYSLEDCFDLVQNGTCKATIVDSVAAAYRVADDYCGLDILEDTFNDEHFGLVLPKDSPYLEELQTAMLHLWEDGVLSDIAEPYFDSSRCAYLEDFEAASSSSQNLTLIDLGGVFAILGMFVIASLVLWLSRRSPVAKQAWAEYDEANRRGHLKEKEEPPLPAVEGNESDLDKDIDTDINSWPRLSTLGYSSSFRRSSSPDPDHRRHQKQLKRSRKKLIKNGNMSSDVDPAAAETAGGGVGKNRTRQQQHALGKDKKFYSFSSSFFNSSSSSLSSSSTLEADVQESKLPSPRGKTTGKARAPDQSLRVRYDRSSVDNPPQWVTSTTNPGHRRNSE